MAAKTSVGVKAWTKLSDPTAGAAFWFLSREGEGPGRRERVPTLGHTMPIDSPEPSSKQTMVNFRPLDPDPTAPDRSASPRQVHLSETMKSHSEFHFPTSSFLPPVFVHAYETEPLGGSDVLPPLRSSPIPLPAPSLSIYSLLESAPRQELVSVLLLSSVTSIHGRWSLRRHHHVRLRRQEPSPRRRRRCPLPDASFPPPPVLPVHADAAQARARDRHVLRAAGRAGARGPGCGAGDGVRAGAFAGGGGGARGVAPLGGEEGAEAVGAADLPGGRRHVQPRRHLHGRRLRLLPLRLANGGRRGADDRDAGHVRALRRRSGRDGVLGAVGAQGAVALLAVAHARVAPPAARRALRAQRRLRHHQRRAGHSPPRLRLLPPRLRPRPLLRRGPRDYAFRHGLHVRPRRPRPPPVPSRPHRECALLPASGCGSQDTPHGQVRGRTVWALPGTQGAGGRWWPRRAGAGARQDQPDSEHLSSGHRSRRRTLHSKILVIFGAYLLI